MPPSGHELSSQNNRLLRTTAPVEDKKLNAMCHRELREQEFKLSIIFSREYGEMLVIFRQVMKNQLEIFGVKIVGLYVRYDTG